MFQKACHIRVSGEYMIIAIFKLCIIILLQINFFYYGLLPIWAGYQHQLLNREYNSDTILL